MTTTFKPLRSSGSRRPWARTASPRRIQSCSSGSVRRSSACRPNPASCAGVMAGMLTAIMNFARVSFAGGADELRRLELGDQTVVIERSPKFIVAVAITGKPPAEVQEEMRIFLERAERRYGPMMAGWTGDPQEFPGLQAMTSRLFL